MILRGWRIDGFGRFQGAEVRELRGGLTVIEGPNEAGKSTLLGFLRFMLFGFARSEQRYPPLQGGRHGGRLYLQDAQGEWELERYQGKPLRLTAPDGRVLGEDALQALLGRIDGAIFRDVFAFSLWELSNLGALSQEEVRDRLYSVGLTGAGKSASAARRALEQRLGLLLKPRSQESRINALLAALSEVRAQLRAAQLQAQDFADLHRREIAAEEAVQRLQQDAQGLRERERFLERLRTAEGAHRLMRRLEEELGRPAVPIDEDRFAAVEELIAARQLRAREIEQRAREAQERSVQIAALQPPQGLLSAAPAVEEMVRDLGLQAERQRRLESLGRDIAACRERLRRHAQALGLPEDAEVTALDYSARQEIDRWASLLQERAVALRRLAEESERAQRELAQGLQDETAAEAAFAPRALDPDSRDLERRIAALDSLHRLQEASQRGRFGFLTIGSIGVLLALAGVLGLFTRLTYMAAPLAVGLTMAVYAALAGGRSTRVLAREAAQAAEEGGLDHPLATGEIERLRREAEVQRQGAAERGKLLERLSEARADREHREAESAERREVLSREQERGAAEQAEFARFKAERGLAADLTPQFLASYAAELQEFVRARGDLADLEAEEREVKGAVDAWQELAREQLCLAERPVPQDPLEFGRAVGELGEEVRRARSALEQMERLHSDVEGLRAGLEDMEAQQQAAEGRISELVRSLGAADFPELRLLREAWKARAQFLDLAAGKAEELERELEKGDPEERQVQADAIALRLRQIEEIELKEALTAALELRRQREAVAQAADVAEFAAQEERVLTQLRRAAQEWRAVFAAKRLLERTLEVYERDRQPEVLRFASEAVSRITGGRYVQVRQRTDEKGLVAVSAAGDQLAPEELSRGTAEQVYLALRLGLAASYGERVAALPLVLDDVLVNFDPVRSRAVLSVLAEFAAAPGRQALLFTCHPFVRELAEEIRGTATLLLPQPAAASEAAAASTLQVAHGAANGELAHRIVSALQQGELGLRELAAAVGAEEKALRKEVEALLTQGRIEVTAAGRGRRYRAAAQGGLFGG